MPASAPPKSIYHFPNYIMAPRTKRTYLDDGGPTGDPDSPLNQLMVDLGTSNGNTMPIEDYKGLPDSVGNLPLTAPNADWRPGDTGFQIPKDGLMTGTNLDPANLALAKSDPGANPWLTKNPDGPNWRNAYGDAPAPKTSPGNADPESGLPAPLTSALDKESGMYASYPVQSQPKWWQRAAGAGVGFLEGMANAGHIKRPIDIAQSEQNILYPGYASKVAKWRSQLAPVEAQAQIEAARQNAALKTEQIGGQAEQRKASAAWRQHLADPHYGMQQIDAETGQAHGLVPEANGEYWVQKNVAGNLTKPGPADRGMQVTDAGIAKILGVPVGSTVDRALYQAGVTAGARQPTQNQTALEMAAAKGDPDAIKALDDENKRHISVAQASRPIPDPNVAADRADRIQERQQGALDRVGEDKISKQSAVLAQRRAEIAKVVPQGMAESEFYAPPLRTKDDTDQGFAQKQALHQQIVTGIQGVNRRFAPQLQAIEDQFSSAGGARGVQTTPMVVNPNTLEYVPRSITVRDASGNARPATITGFNPTTGKPIVRLQ